ncbi:multidrug resistance-associated ABC transporter [Pholiota conissans]|uniref:Multidrug resistance-associated ABC transporter n=1 Tax=Pholiota conissans TaxID=109636 RepID=A0A9P5Z153_9AGAR|nr:multidrug resistance-associated ABC transporter [Pholiota conissans]
MFGTNLFFDQTLSPLYASNWDTVKTIYRDDVNHQSLYLPFLVAGVSMIILFSQLLYQKFFSTNEGDLNMKIAIDARMESADGFATIIRAHAHSHGGLVIYAYKFVCLLCCLALFSLAIVGFLAKDTTRDDIPFPDALIMATFCYNALLASLSLIPGSWNKSIMRHNNVVLLATFGVYAYRDIWPLATYSPGPIDAAEGHILWVKVGIVTIAAVIIPLFIPTQYVPVDPKDPMEVPNPEQTASIFSLMFYIFVDHIVFEAYSVPHLSLEQLPPLADYEKSEKLTVGAFPLLDPRHMFICFMRIFCWEYLHMAISIILMVFASFASPVAMNRILVSLESSHKDDNVKAWAWVVALFLGPVFVSICFQWYQYKSTTLLTRTQGIITELIFEHSLRVRFRGETSTDEEHITADAKAAQFQSTPAGNADSSRSGDLTKGRNKNDSIIGKLNTLVTVDIDNIVAAKDFLLFFVQVPLELILSIIFLYVVLGWSAIVGFISIILLLPVPGHLASRMEKIQTAKMEKTDARVGAVAEVVRILRMVKLFGWEKQTSDRLKGKREIELAWLWKDKVVCLVNDIINFVIPTITMLITYGTYTFIMGESLNASKVFSSMSVFETLRNALHRSSWIFSQLVKGKVSLDRVGNFLREAELLDEYQIDRNAQLVRASEHEDVIGFRDALFTWSTKNDAAFKLKIEGDLFFKRNAINLIIGPTGSGKTSILMALLGEMHFIPSTIDSWFSLPRSGGVAYAAQESWVQNETIRNNILFGCPYDEERYEKVIYQCGLKRDIELFEDGDRTEVGERGVTLRSWIIDELSRIWTYIFNLQWRTKGNPNVTNIRSHIYPECEARVTLARAVYSSSQIILLDDVLATLDSHTSNWIVEECLKGDLIYGRTVLFVTHNIGLTVSIANHIVTINADGIVHEIGNSTSILTDSIPSYRDKQEQDNTGIEETTNNMNQGDDGRLERKLIPAEEIAEGRVSWKSFALFLEGIGGHRPILFMATYFLGLALFHVGNMISVWFLGFWGSQYDTHAPEDVLAPFYLSLYCIILLASLLVYAVAATVYNSRTQRASRTINDQLMDSVLRSTFRWLDETPSFRIIARCTQDIGAIDGNVTQLFAHVVETAITLIIKLSGPIVLTPAFLVPALFIGGLGAYMGNVYLKAQMSVKREMSNARSPVLEHFGAAITGLVSIRAYGAQETFKRESLNRIDHLLRISRMSNNLNRWIGIRMDMLGAMFTAGVAAYLLIRKSLSAANIGFSLGMAIEFCSMILWMVSVYNEFEVEANSLERIQAYIDIDHEPEATEAGKPPAAWPTSGELRVSHLSARYSQTGPEVLHDLSFHVKSGERIGIVGRTGSGKSSLTLSLLRCIITNGEVYYDGIDTSKVNLDDLRSNITIIPQIPELLSGTLRRNIDPFDRHDDLTLNNALRSSGLFAQLQTQSEIETDDEPRRRRLNLDSHISSSGDNLSVGQRQIIALARALVRNTKLLILDEATSAIDRRTDSFIQSSLHHQLGTDVTVLIVAHRLQTVMDVDKVMVLDSGRIVEFDSPQVLLQKKGGAFKALVDDSDDKDMLYAMTERRNNPDPARGSAAQGGGGRKR